MKFQTDFNTTQKIEEFDRWVLSDFPPMWSHKDTGFALGFDTIIYHSVGRCFKITWGDNMIVVGENPRPTIEIYNLPDEYWVSEWFYLPADFKLKRWLVLLMASAKWVPNDQRYPGMSVCNQIMELEGTQASGEGTINLKCQVRRVHYIDPQPQYTREFLQTKQIKLNRGEWFNIRLHMKHDLDGKVESWIQSESIPLTKLIDYSGDTRHIGWEGNNFVPIDHYKRVDEPVSIIYFDDLRIDEYNFFNETPPGPVIEPPPPGPFTMEVKPCIVTAAGAPLALLTGLRVIREYLPGWFVRGYYDFSKIVLAGW